MQVIYALEQLHSTQYSIFLAGPSPRDYTVASWRPEAIQILEKLGFTGTVFIPEQQDGFKPGTFDRQVQWEIDALEMATVIVFWIPRSDKLPGFTTNDEWGSWKKSGKVVLGVPPKSKGKCKYQIWFANKLNVPFSDSLSQTCQNAIDKMTL